MRRVLVLSVLLLLPACSAHRDPEVGAPPQQTIHIPGSNGGVPMTMSISPTVSPSTRVVAATADDVWRALPSVYATLAIPVEERDVQARTLGNPALKLRRRLGDTGLGKYLDCGSTQGGPSADTYEIVMSVQSRVQAVSADSTMVTTVVEARGRPVAFSANYVSCQTRGLLERRFFEILAVQLHP